MKLPLLARLTLTLAICAERLAWAAWGLHDRALRRCVARIPAAYPVPPSVRAEVERPAPQRSVTDGYVRLDAHALELRDQAGRVIASGAGLLGFERQMLNGGRAS